MKLNKLIGNSYDIIYADPPWDYNNKKLLTNGKSTRDVKFHYPTVVLNELKCLPINNISNTNCLLFMWSSSPHLNQAIALGETWGFKYSTVAFVWNKINPVIGHYTMSSCELCLVFKKGKIPSPRGSQNERQFLQELKSKHSCKPHEIRDRISQMFPTQKKIELFARHKTKNWDYWGNEV